MFPEDVGHTVSKAHLRASHAVMYFIRVQHKGIAWHAVAQRPLVVKALNTGKGTAYRVCVMTMRVVAMATKPGFDALHAARRSAAYDPVRGG